MSQKIYHFLVYLFIRILQSTYRLRFSGLEHLQKAQALHPKGAFIFAVWHEHTLGVIYSIKGFSPCAIVSSSKDGELIANTMTKIGFSMARGSSSRGGGLALYTAAKSLKRGTPVIITVDGPKGPRHKPKPGVIKLSKKTKSAILPMSPITENPKIFNKSWDKHKFPKPFSKIILRFGEIMTIDEDLTDEGLDQHIGTLEQRLFSNEKRAEQDLKDWKNLPKTVS
jgi:lysophospholipid acyltransferase (LPLAT)-like uncharacterized protein